MSGQPPADPRFSFANERTFLAWNRTAMALIGGGLLVAQLLETLPRAAGLALALPSIALGAALAVAGFARWRERERELRRREPLVRARADARLLAAGTAVISLLALAVSIWSELTR